jgi:hypothetical protein
MCKDGYFKQEVRQGVRGTPMITSFQPFSKSFQPWSTTLKMTTELEGLRHIHTSRPAYPSTNSTYPADPYPAIIAIPSPSHVQLFRST